MKILLLGGQGQIGYELGRSLAPLGELLIPHRKEFDLEGPFLGTSLPWQDIRVIINCAAYTAVDLAQKEQERALIINAKAPGLLAQKARESGALLVHYSTDYVFDGHKVGPYTESDKPGPLNIYGKTKLEGERALETSGCRYLLLRTSWVYSTRRKNFVKTIASLAKGKKELRVVNDQVGIPTSAEFIADISAHLVRELMDQDHPGGLYHLSPRGQTSWYGFAKFILEQLHLRGKVTLKAQRSENSPGKAQRPKNSSLDASKLAQDFNFHLPPWESLAKRVLREGWA